MVIDDYYEGDPIKAIKNAVKCLQGAYAFLIMFQEFPGKIYCIRNGSPLVATYTEKGAIKPCFNLGVIVLLRASGCS